MEIKLKTKHYVSLGFASVVIILDFILFFKFIGGFGPKDWYFSPIIVIAALVGGLPFIKDFMAENKRQKELETKFLEFVRSLVENVRSGVSIPQAIIQVSRVQFGALTPYIKKLANQLEWGYPLHIALTIFAKDTKNPVIARAIAIVIEAEKSGGDMSSVLEAVTRSVLEIKNIKDERRTNAYTQVIQGYIIYFFFVFIMIVLQIYLLPRLSAVGGELGSGLGTIGVGGIGGGGTGSGGELEFGPIFIATIVVQGLFAGLMLGKFSEGDFKSGLKHSLVMSILGYLIITTANGIFLDTAVSTASSMLLFIPKKLMKIVRKHG